MENDYKPPRKPHAGIAFLLAGLGLFSLNCAASVLVSNSASGLGWMLVTSGAALIVMAIFWGRGRI